jgi:hypothetical protein
MKRGISNGQMDALKEIEPQLRAADCETAEDVWRTVGSDRITGISQFAARCGVTEDQLVKSLFDLAIADKRRAEESWIARHWADLCVAAVTIILGAIIIFTVRQRPFIPRVVTVSRPIGAFDFIDSADVIMKPAWQARTAFFKVDDVVGRLALIALSPGQRIERTHLGTGKISRDAIAGRTVIPVRVTADQMALRPRAGQEIGLMLSTNSNPTPTVLRLHGTLLHVSDGPEPVLLTAVPRAQADAALALLPHAKAVLSVQATGN